MSEDVAALILAAGKSSRFGTDKRVAQLADGMSMLGRTCEVYRGTPGRRVVVLDTIGIKNHALLDAIPAEFELCESARSWQGQAYSLADGLNHLGDVDAALVALGDMPFVTPETIGALLTTWQKRKPQRRIVIRPNFQGSDGHPILFDGSLLNDLRARSVPGGGASLLQQADVVLRVPVTDRGCVLDIDRPQHINGVHYRQR